MVRVQQGVALAMQVGPEMNVKFNCAALGPRMVLLAMDMAFATMVNAFVNQATAHQHASSRLNHCSLLGAALASAALMALAI
jgi:hypothetical protein